MFKVIWDKENNGVRLTMSAAGEALNVSPRPVFFEELDFLGLKEYGWSYPNSAAPLLWACDRRYYYRGELVLELKGGDLMSSADIDFIVSPLQLEPISIAKLRERNEDSIFLLEREAMEFIFKEAARYLSLDRLTKVNPEIDFQRLARELSAKTKEEHVVIKEDCDSFDIMPLEQAKAQGKAIAAKQKIDLFVSSFSGGKDSQVVLDLVARTLPTSVFVVIYSDTGYEIPDSFALYEETKTFYHSRYPDMRFFSSHNHQELMEYWNRLGAPSRVQRWCCSVMKSAPLTRKIREIVNNGRQPKALLFDGVRAEESPNRANRDRIGYSVKHTNIINVSPILEWNATEIYLYILLRELPFNSAYRKGFSRVGCVICPYSSKWSECIASKLYPQSLRPFIGYIRESLEKAHTHGIDNYIKDGKWKERAGGRTVECEVGVTFVEESENFHAVVKNPREDILTWMSVLGPLKGELLEKGFDGSIQISGKIYPISLKYLPGNTVKVIVKDCNKDVILISHLKKIIYKSSYCIHCEVCEVDCPTGALSVVPTVSIDKNKCIHCLKCLDFDGKGCISASSISITTGNNNKTMQTAKSGINRYNDGMGLRETWLKKYFETSDTFFDNDLHGLNTRYQLPPFTNWLREAGILNEASRDITALGKLLQSIFFNQKQIVWEVIFINLCENSEVCKWFHANIDFGRFYSKQELEVIIQSSYPDLKDRTLKNPLNSLLNTFKESPLNNIIPIAKAESQNRKPGIIRCAHDEISLAGLAYSLYQYAEKYNRRALTVSEFYATDQQEGIIRQFGIHRDTMEQCLRSLEELNVLRADLKMGLDNINLRNDLSAIDALKMLI